MELWCTGESKYVHHVASLLELLLTVASGGAFLLCGTCLLSSTVLTCTCPDRTGLAAKMSSLELAAPVDGISGLGAIGSGVFVTADGRLSCRVTA
jgi:hypothetical protein